MRRALLSSAYFGPVQWYQKLHRYDRCTIERHDNYVKQTYRNRCVIATANGPQTLTVPIERYDGDKCPMRDIRISDHGSWRHLHRNALVSAYGESPFFDYYADDVLPFFERRWTYLFDFNMEIMSTMCSLLDIEPTVDASDEYLTDADADDYRDAIRPKHPLDDPSFEPRPYYQVYALRHGFLPNISILDLLFNEGPESVLYL
ncbi:MAG: WbqC family protein [Prevotella sp.]